MLFEGQAGALSEYAAAIARLDALASITVIERANIPSSSNNGDAFIVLGSPTGAFAGHANQLAFRIDGAWVFMTPADGMLAFIVNEQNLGRLAYYDQGTWVAIAFQASDVGDFTGTFSATPTEAEVQNFADHIDDLILSLRDNGTMSDT